MNYWQKPTQILGFAVALALFVPGEYVGADTSGAALTEPADAETIADPLEPINRFTSNVNRILRGAVIDPLVDGYQYIAPEPVERGVSNFFSNLSEPVTALSSLLQGDAANAGTSTGRFLINSTLGLAGTSDYATEFGLEQRREDLGQAFGAHGVEPGAHIVLPILGPSNMRDATGDILTGLASPLPLAVTAADGAVSYSDNQDTIHALERSAFDPYVTEREAYEQNREFLITNGEPETGDFPSFADRASDPGIATTQK